VLLLEALLDENLSRRMLGMLEPYVPESSHVSFVGLEGAKDSEIWSFAGESNFVIVTRDSDFSELAALHGPPPKVIVLQISNCRWRDMASPIIRRHKELVTYLGQPDVAVVELRESS
jgi:predicted nuclease of predicted toxin-antitoxin system